MTVERADASSPGEMQVTVAEGVSLRVLAWPAVGSRAGAPPFLLLHGLASTAAVWEPVATRLAAAGHRVFAADFRGHGLSDKPDGGYDIATYAADLVGLIEGLEMDRPILVGHSLGAFVILEALARNAQLGRRVRGVVLVEGALVDAYAQFATLEDCLARVTLPPVTGTPAPRLEAYFRHVYPDWPDARVAGMMSSVEVLPDGTAEWRLRPAHLQALARSMWEWHAGPLLPAIGVPSLWIVADTGDATWTEAKREAAAAVERDVPGARICWLVADHDVHAHRPGDVAALIQALAGDDSLPS